MGTIGGTEKVQLTDGLLALIIMVQDYKRFLLSKSLFNRTNNKSELDWYKETQRFFNNLDSDILSTYKLSKNRISFEKVLNFEVTTEMKSTNTHELFKNFTF